MTKLFKETHESFKINFTNKGTVWGSEEADMCKHHLGDTDPNSLLGSRAWFTAPGRIYIRRDCLKNELATWFALKNNE